MQHLVPSPLLAALLLAGCDASGTIVDTPVDTEPWIGPALTGSAVTLQADVKGQYLCAENGGGGAVNANRPQPRAWETFGLIDRDGGDLVSGDLVLLQSATGRYLMAVNGGGGELNATSENQLDWETFRIIKRSGTGTIANGDVVGLQTLVSGRWVSAQDGGGGGVNASAATFGSWESFRLGMGGTAPPPAPSPPTSDWKLVWHDEFDGPEIDESKWSYEVKGPGWVNHELQSYTYRRRENARIENGALVIEGRHDGYNGSEYSSARLHTAGHASWKYGRIEARMQLSGGRGTWPAFWMMPNDFSRGWPACGEIDIMEEVGYDQDSIHATTHSKSYNWQRAEQRTSSTLVNGVTTGYHVYAAEWGSEGIDFFVDGRKYFSSPNDHTGEDAWPFDKSFYVILNLAIGGDWGGAQGVDPDAWPRQMKVDYVRVYQR
jgi:beta-glucanase (GH16 family)